MRSFTYYLDLASITFNEGDDATWIDLMKVGSYQHTTYGNIDFTAERLQRFADSVNNNVRGIDPDIDYDHKQDPAKGSKAAGWIKSARVVGGVLQGLVQFTAPALKAIKNKEYRYFSPEFADLWENSSGQKFKDVLMGGGLTNRPFLKNLAPINLSELTFTDGAPTTKEDEVDPKQLREKLGLSAETTEEQVNARLGELKSLSEALGALPPTTPPAPAPTNQPPAPVSAPAPVMLSDSLSGDLKKLAESNPAVKILMSHVDETTRLLAEQNVKLAEQNVVFKLGEFDNAGGSNFVLTPVARELVSKIMLSEGVKPEVQTMIWDLMTQMRDGHKFFVEMGERVRGANPTLRDTSATKRFTEAVIAAQSANPNLSYADAVEQVSRSNRELADDYRIEATAFHA